MNYCTSFERACFPVDPTGPAAVPYIQYAGNVGRSGIANSMTSSRGHGQQLALMAHTTAKLGRQGDQGELWGPWQPMQLRKASSVSAVTAAASSHRLPAIATYI